MSRVRVGQMVWGGHATKILVVDDEPSIVRSTSMLLSELGFEVFTTSDPAEVLPLLRREKPDILLQDVRMPGLDLDKLLESVRADPKVAGVPVVLFSASMDLADVQSRVGAAAILEKPFKPHEILGVIDEALGRKSLGDPGLAST